ncbi:hypothetical protein EVAR_82530_1 [Eumeta japonica]|uniref:Uncharacterized protein n=1 Tax=Eumeta variegata TaxID=151549 RepID=A0A4C1UWH7_EUMVA|nr:hypothetical protein EVAR_82530_1 [Eumeta japonica]
MPCFSYLSYGKEDINFATFIRWLITSQYPPTGLAGPVGEMALLKCFVRVFYVGAFFIKPENRSGKVDDPQRPARRAPERAAVIKGIPAKTRALTFLARPSAAVFTARIV